MDALIKIFDTYSLPNIIIFVVLLASAIMGVGRFIEWAYGLLKKYFGKEHRSQLKDANLKMQLNNIEDKMNNLERALTNVQNGQYNLKQGLDCTINELKVQLNDLAESDKDSIKAYLTDKHHIHCYVEKWIDDYSLDSAERRYIHYKKAGGNSFIDRLMDELRKLPNQKPSKGPGE